METMKLLDPTHPRRTLIIAEETANLLTHGLALLLSIYGTVLLWQVAGARGDFWQKVGCGVYGATLVSLYAASTLSHSFYRPWVRHFFRMLDQVCIFLLIAGTYTPFALAYFRGGWWLLLLGAIWLCALVGIFFKVFFSRLENVATGAYILMAWLPALAARPIIEHVPSPVLLWIVAGGVMYTLGTLFLYMDQRNPYFHAVWHLFVMGGSACHYGAVLLIFSPLDLTAILGTT
jgi:hemolysin III